MNLTYNRANILQGSKLRKESEENPTTFAEYNGADEQIAPDNLDSKYDRKAGDMGAYALSLMTNPASMKQASTWNERFGQSNQGAAFNQAKTAQVQAEMAARRIVGEA